MVDTFPNITKPNAKLPSVTGNHIEGKSFLDVEGFNIFSTANEIRYFPKIGEVFPHLKIVRLSAVEMIEIHQSDLKPLIDLEFLNLAFNSIQFLEENLFEFNKNLKMIDFWMNKISYIAPNVFDNLINLNILWLLKNDCVSENVDDRDNVLKLIKKVKVECGNSSKFDEKLEKENFTIWIESFKKSQDKKLDIEFLKFKLNFTQTLNDEFLEINQKIENLQNSFENSLKLESESHKNYTKNIAENLFLLEFSQEEKFKEFIEQNEQKIEYLGFELNLTVEDAKLNFHQENQKILNEIVKLKNESKKREKNLEIILVLIPLFLCLLILINAGLIITFIIKRKKPKIDDEKDGM